MYRTVSWFSALARLRQLIPSRRDELDVAVLASPERIALALQSAGVTVSWRSTHNDEGDFYRTVVACPLTALVVGDSLLSRGLPAIEISGLTLGEIDGELHLLDAGDLVVLPLSVPTITLISHEAAWAVCTAAAPAKQREDESLVRHATRTMAAARREDAINATPSGLVPILTQLCADGRRIEATRIYRDRINCTMSQAVDHIQRLYPWWPPEPQPIPE